MGASAARITAADFLTPPELENYRLAPDGAGRVGGLRLEFVSTNGPTSLAGCYQQVPLRILPPFQFAANQPALLYLLNPTAGLMDGDAHLVEVTARTGSRAVVVGQSATRIHPCLKGFSTQQWQMDVEPGGVLVMLPGPSIPFQGSRYYQRVAINLAADAGLVWGDILLAGRYARGDQSEQFQFELLVQDLTVRREGRLVFRDHFCWRGPWGRETATWHFGPALASGSLFVSGGAGAKIMAPEGACFATAAGDTCYRWQGTSEFVTAAVVQTGLRAAAALAGSVDQPWLPPDRDLAPNHWFTLAAQKPILETEDQP